ncbi:Neurotrophin-4 [Merluccius polli]|uniref:Neurotrophin-4 n=1 Tax=Merluccius polli TaxID=89951 RepID=A0AA47MYT0_MERPO|nr:Neurotrophin-4 [Merluccius polli]
MHWLPLVAMVIASALPFPYSPVTRIVAATTETSGSHEDDGGQLLLPPPPLPAPAHNFSDGNASRDPCNANCVPGPAAGAGDHQTTRSAGEPLLRTGQDSEDSERSNSDSDRDPPGVSAQGEKNGRTSNFSCHDDRVSAENAVTEDHSRGGAAVEDSTLKENLRDSRDGGIAGKDDSPSPLPAPDPANVSPATSQQRGLGPFSQWEGTRVATETGEGSPVSEGEGRSPRGGTPDAGPGRPRGVAEEDLEAGMMGVDGIQGVDELFLDAHPRVLFSPSASPPQHPPLLLMLESGALPEGEGGPGWAAPHAGNRRIKRSDVFGPDKRRGERSVCESESVWVTDKKTAIDNHGRTVTILPEIQTPTGALKQYFYETRCRRGEQQQQQLRGSPPRGSSRGGGGGATPAGAGLGLGVAGSGCLGVDKKQWKSECKPKHSFVRALAKDANNRMGWRWIRIDSSCVCVLLSRVSRQSVGKV